MGESIQGVVPLRKAGTSTWGNVQDFYFFLVSQAKMEVQRAELLKKRALQQKQKEEQLESARLLQVKLRRTVLKTHTLTILCSTVVRSIIEQAKADKVSLYNERLNQSKVEIEVSSIVRSLCHMSKCVDDETYSLHLRVGVYGRAECKSRERPRGKLGQQSNLFCPMPDREIV